MLHSMLSLAMAPIEPPPGDGGPSTVSGTYNPWTAWLSRAVAALALRKSSGEVSSPPNDYKCHPRAKMAGQDSLIMTLPTLADNTVAQARLRLASGDECQVSEWALSDGRKSSL